MESAENTGVKGAVSSGTGLTVAAG